MLFQELEDAARILQGGVGLRVALFIGDIGPGRRVITSFFLLIAGIQTVVEGKFRIDEKGGIGVMDDIVPFPST